MTGGYETLAVRAADSGILVVTLDRPEVRNALNTQMGRDLRALFQPLQFTPGDLRCIVITGAGDKAFCAGGDLKERKGMTEEAWRAQHAIFEEAIYAVMECAVPVIAAVNGAAYAGGCELALASDFVYAAENAQFALTEVTLGIMPGCGGTQNLPRAVGTRRAKEILLTGRPFSARQACEWGLVNAIHPQSEVVAAALATAACIAGNAPIAVRQAKKSVQTGMQMDLPSALAFEVQAYDRMIATEDRREGIDAFNEKRKPRFKGR
jgi:enoyl-CoA hydratase/carnithine racemase